MDHWAWAMAADATLWVGPLTTLPRAYVAMTTGKKIYINIYGFWIDATCTVYMCCTQYMFIHGSTIIVKV